MSITCHMEYLTMCLFVWRLCANSLLFAVSHIARFNLGEEEEVKKKKSSLRRLTYASFLHYNHIA